MNEFSDQVLARRLLEARELGNSFGLFLRRSIRSYLILFSYWTVILIAFGMFQFWIPFYISLGCLAGCLLRDFGWIRNHLRIWQFTVRVLDWDKVQELAQEKSVVQ